nr:MAG TPA: DNA primase [Caudoviricetes sp.]
MMENSHQSFSGKLTVCGNSIHGDIAALRDEFVNRIDPFELLRYFDVQHPRAMGKEIRAKCPIHDGTNTSSFTVRTVDSSGDPIFRWYCYGNNCHEEHGSDIIGFVMSAAGTSFSESIKFLMEFCGMTEEDAANIAQVDSSIGEIISRNELSKICSELERFNDAPPDSNTRHPFLNEDFVERSLGRRNQYFIDRGISKHVLDVFEVGHCAPPDSPWMYSMHKNRAVIPIRDEHFKLVGVSGRAETQEIAAGDSKFRFLPGSDRFNTLYGFYLSRPYIEEKRSVIIVEGFADLWKCWMAGYKNVVAVMGKKITDVQMMKILRTCHRALICFDYDEGRNEENAYKIAERLSEYINVDVDFIGNNVDFGASPVEKIQEFFEKHPKYI